MAPQTCPAYTMANRSGCQFHHVFDEIINIFQRRIPTAHETRFVRRNDARARFHPVEHRPAGEEPDADYPYFLTTGRYKEHYNSGAQTRQVKALTDAKPEPRLQVHPRLATSLGALPGGRMLVESRRGSVAFQIELSPDIRPDTLFAPFHWGGKQAANILTSPALDPTSRMPEFKVCAVRARAVTAEAAA